MLRVVAPESITHSLSPPIVLGWKLRLISILLSVSFFPLKNILMSHRYFTMCESWLKFSGGKKKSAYVLGGG